MIVAVLILVVFTVAGCGTKATGGGWIESVEGNEARATFGFYAQALEDCECSWENAEGNFTLTDHGAGQQFHGKVVHMWLLGGGDEIAKFEGITSVCGRNSIELPVTISVRDSNESGKCDNGDEIEILIGNMFRPVYYNSGELQGGNINVE
ncbi:MAG: hypothetical protein JW702_09440 [Clostridiales bacterium]|nr:hypothetical protein [Clostridiales bacterium]